MIRKCQGAGPDHGIGRCTSAAIVPTSGTPRAGCCAVAVGGVGEVEGSAAAAAVAATRAWGKAGRSWVSGCGQLFQIALAVSGEP